MDIRNGHAQTVEKVLRWVDEGARRCTPLLLLSLYAHSICGQYSLVMGISAAAHCGCVHPVCIFHLHSGAVAAEGGVEGTTICDAGCGTGSLAIPLALRVGGCTSWVGPSAALAWLPACNMQRRSCSLSPQTRNCDAVSGGGLVFNPFVKKVIEASHVLPLSCLRRAQP
jgi:hypothetical protein